MKLTDAPVHQNRWRLLADAPFGWRSAERLDDKLVRISFGLDASQGKSAGTSRRRYRIHLTVKDAIDLHAWLAEQLTQDGLP